MRKIFDQLKGLIYNEYFILSIIIICGVVARLYKINSPIADWHSWRQADTASVSRIYSEEGINVLYPRYYDISSIQSGIFNPTGYRFVEFPIYNIIHSFLFMNFPGLSLEVWGRLLTVFVVSISTILVYAISKNYLSGLASILAAFFFALLPYNIFFGRVILPDPLAVTFALSSLFFFIRFLKFGHTKLLYLASLFLALSILIKPFTAFYAVPVIFLFVKKYDISKAINDPKIRYRLILSTGIILIPFILWRIWISNFPEGIPFFEWMFNGDRIRFRPAFWRWIFGERLGLLILGAWGLVPFSLSILEKKPKNYFLHTFLLGALLYVVIVASANVRHDYYQILTIPAIAIALGRGAEIMFKGEFVNRNLGRLFLTLAIVLMFMASWLKVREFYKINHPEILVAGAAVDRLTPKNAKVIASYNGDTAFLYQTRRFGWPAVDTSFDELIERGATHYVSLNFNDEDTKFLVNNFKVIERTDQYIIIDLRVKNPPHL